LLKNYITLPGTLRAKHQAE